MTSNYPIHPPYEVMYIQSMLFNSQSAVDSLIHLSDVLDEMTKNPSGRIEDMRDDVVLNHLQNVILQAGSLSKYCFPSRQGHEARADTIKVALGVADASPLKNRNLRNSIEHFDERLDEYLANGVVGYFFPQYVGLEPNSRDVPSHIFRAYYVDNDTFVLLGVRYHFGPIAAEVMRVHKELHRCFDEGGRLWASK